MRKCTIFYYAYSIITVAKYLRDYYKDPVWPIRWGTKDLATNGDDREREPRERARGTFAFASWARLIAIDGKIKATWNATATVIGKPHEMFRNDSVTRSKPEPTMFLSERTVHVAPWLLFRLHKSLLFTWKSARTAIFPRISLLKRCNSIRKTILTCTSIRRNLSIFYVLSNIR